jgi:hypothetical protein
MTGTEAIVSTLEDKIVKMISLYEELKNENAKLLAEASGMQQLVHEKEVLLKESQDRYEQLKLARLLVSGSEDIHDAKLKVNKIVREIDKCISLLNK